MSRDLDEEFAKFEEEISKLSGEQCITQPSPVVISAPPVANLTIKSSINIQLPTITPSLAAAVLPSHASSLAAASALAFKPPQVKTTETSGIKRDASGNIINSSAATAAAKASSLADKTKDNNNGKDASNKKKKLIRSAGGQTWEDESLVEWDPDDYRLFCGDLGNEVNDDMLARAFQKYQTFQKAKVVRDKRTNKSKGYGFVSFKDSNDYLKAMREMDGKYVGNRPIKLRKSTWKDRNLEVVRKKESEKQKMGLR